MRIRAMLTAAAVGSVVLTGITVAPSVAAEEPGEVTGVVTGVLTPEEEEKVHAEVDPTVKVDMYYEGKKIDPASDWNGAEVCAEVSEDGTMQCFDDSAAANKHLAVNAPTAEARAGAKEALNSRKYQDCPSGWVCLWQDSNFTGRRLQWPTYDTAKTRHLDQYSPSFRDKASSAYVNRPQRGVEMYDFRTGMPDPHMFLGAGYSRYSNFKNIDYVYGGSWNDRVDAIKF